jgi:hypothetical protein
MIHESFYWKKELYDNFQVIARFRFLKRRYKQSYVKVEKAILMGAYIIRKLDEAQKIPPEFLKTQESISLYKSKSTIVDFMNSHHLERHYNLEEAHKENKDWGFILNQIIHSYSLVYTFDSKDQPDGLLINSDWTKKKALFAIPLKLILTMFLKISEGDIILASSKREIEGTDNHGKVIFGEMKLQSANYAYPNIDIPTEIEKTMQGEIYKRVEFE